jgi:hypothetical protein
MSQDTFVVAESITSQGQLKADQGHISSDGVAGTLTTVGLTTTNSTLTNSTITTLTPSNIVGGVSGGVSGVAITISGTVATSQRKSKVLPGSAVTSCLMAVGTTDGQDLTVVNVAQAAGSSVSFIAAGSAAGSSHLASNVVISGLSSASFTWDANTGVWYPVIN